ncbi:MAG: chemotaxis response regulator protein-glutamate methylesterase [Fulvimarina manganoxydans]|uniref:protein-glutamate methylesterase/protein-glutamine glutaminase n=1 Tax=Fulvimarina manganoxydans TaxID=937218 RepID=UPI0023576EC6|nr:chemotaxis response regulator protein-glutamate methylesterase [Fulvimarina manganoxydans]MCK5932638.1 chemotaxis response regulator protein-glutamate methylesterase [Fulvimarina manganoxydans]
MPSASVLVVDDSATMRALIRHALSQDPEIRVVGEASNPFEAREKMKALDPDVVTLDVEMPNMNGIDFLQKIMQLRPTPVIMVSNLTAPGAAVTLAALEIGAFDCVAKPSARDTMFQALPGLVKEAARARPALERRRRALRAQAAPAAAPVQARAPAMAGAAPIVVDRPAAVARSGANYQMDVIGIGSSTGGVEALLQVLADFPADCPPTVIVQHLPAAFTGSFSQRLDRVCPATVTEARDGEPLRRGHVYLAPGGERHLRVKQGSQPFISLAAEEAVSGHRPSVDVMMASLAKSFGRRAVGCILTGMGRDGAQGLLEMRQAGAKTLAQDEETSLVYGMPRVAFEIGAAEKRLPLGRIARQIFA